MSDVITCYVNTEGMSKIAIDMLCTNVINVINIQHGLETAVF